MVGQENVAYVNAFRTEHHEMHKLAELLRETLDKQRSWSAAAASEAVHALKALTAHLQEHFALEETGGYLEQSLAAAPRFSHDAARLLGEHGELLRRANEAIVLAQGAKDEIAWEKLKSVVRSLLTALLAHETAENRIVQEAFNSGDEI